MTHLSISVDMHALELPCWSLLCEEQIQFLICAILRSVSFVCFRPDKPQEGSGTFVSGSLKYAQIAVSPAVPAQKKPALPFQFL
jgi:hypothetical protein